MSRLEYVFRELRRRGEGGLIAFVTAGDPDASYTPLIAKALVEGGVDVLEIGIPFSDPIADGPTVQASTVRALKAGMKPRMVFNIIDEINGYCDVPIVILTYFNPVFRMGLKSFMEYCASHDVDGVIIPDLPVEEAGEYKSMADKYGVSTIFLAAPSTSSERLKKIVSYTSGFLYLVALFGVTGARERLSKLTIDLIRRVYPYTRDNVPLAVGFGLSRPEHISTVIKAGADAAIVGSRFIKIIEGNLGNLDNMLNELKYYAHILKEATLDTRR